MKAAAESPVWTYRTGYTPSVRFKHAESNHISTNVYPVPKALEGKVMACPICTTLEGALARRNAEYIAACTGVFRQISSKLEGYRVVEMERALSDLRMHSSAYHSDDAGAVAQPLLNAVELNLVAMAHLSH